MSSELEPKKATGLSVPSAIAERALAAQEAGINSTEGGEHYRQLPILGFVQSQSPRERKALFGEGTAFIISTEEVVIRNGESCAVVPLFFYTEFVTWADRDDSNTPSIIASSTDRTSDIARKCQDPEARIEPYGDGFKCNHREHLNFIVMIVDGPAAGNTVCISFSGGDHKFGRKFIQKLSSMQIDGVPIQSYMTRWNLSIGERGNDKGEWYGAELMRDMDNPFVPDDEIEVFEKAHLEMKEFRDKLQVQYADESTSEPDDGVGSADNEM